VRCVWPRPSATTGSTKDDGGREKPGLNELKGDALLPVASCKPHGVGGSSRSRMLRVFPVVITGSDSYGFGREDTEAARAGRPLECSRMWVVPRAAAAARRGTTEELGVGSAGLRLEYMRGSWLPFDSVCEGRACFSAASVPARTAMPSSSCVRVWRCLRRRHKRSNSRMTSNKPRTKKRRS
jgi:hypothetical protein